MSEMLRNAIVRIRRDSDHQVVGVGFLIDEGKKTILTCAHVVNEAIENSSNIEKPRTLISLDFPFLDSKTRLDARVTLFFPKTPENTDDIAVLQALDELPAGAEAVNLVAADTYSGHEFGVYGFPVGFEDNGQYVEGTLQEILANNQLQAVGKTNLGHFVEEGFSGAPVYDKNLDAVIGMMMAIANEREKRVAYISSFYLLGKNINLTLSGVRQIDETKHEHQQKTPTNKPNLIESKTQRNILNRVHNAWVEGVLNTALGDTGRLPLNFIFSKNAQYKYRTISEYELYRSSSHIEKLFYFVENRLVILGGPGSGKTILLLILAEELIKDSLEINTYSVPLVFKLSSWSDGKLEIEDWIIRELSKKYQINRSTGKSLVKNQNIILLLDGLDELPELHVPECIAAINSYCESNRHVGAVVTCRSETYESLHTKLLFEAAIEITPLTRDHVEDHLSRKRQDTIRRLIDEDMVLKDWVKTPLLFNIIVVSYGGKSKRQITLTQDRMTTDLRREHLFKDFVYRVFADSTSSGESVYSLKQLEHYLSWLANRLKNKSESDFYLDNLQPSWLHKDDLQAYGLASGTIYGLLGGGSFGLAVFAYGFSTLVAFELLFGFIATLLVLQIIIGFISVRATSFPEVKPLQTGIALGRGLGLFTSIIGAIFVIYMMGNGIEASISATSLLIGVISAFMVRIPAFTFGMKRTKELNSQSAEMLLNVNLIEEYSESLHAVIFRNLLSGVAINVNTSRSRIFVKQNTLYPNQGIRRSMANAVLVGSTFGIFAFFLSFALSPITIWIVDFIGVSLSTGESVGLIPLGGAIIIGVCAALIMSLGSGLLTCIKHVVIRLLLSRRGYSPLNYRHFLDFTTSLGLTRRVGGGYIFRHEELKHYFSDMHTVP